MSEERELEAMKLFSLWLANYMPCTCAEEIWKAKTIDPDCPAFAHNSMLIKPESENAIVELLTLLEPLYAQKEHEVIRADRAKMLEVARKRGVLAGKRAAWMAYWDIEELLRTTPIGDGEK